MQCFQHLYTSNVFRKLLITKKKLQICLLGKADSPNFDKHIKTAQQQSLKKQSSRDLSFSTGTGSTYGPNIY